VGLDFRENIVDHKNTMKLFSWWRRKNFFWKTCFVREMNKKVERNWRGIF
jgi:hypothetical protein